jgi:hypothetical protein
MGHDGDELVQTGSGTGPCCRRFGERGDAAEGGCVQRRSSRCAWTRMLVSTAITHRDPGRPGRAADPRTHRGVPAAGLCP